MTTTLITSATGRRSFTCSGLIAGLALAICMTLSVALAPSAQARPQDAAVHTALLTGAEPAEATLVHHYGYRRGYYYPRKYYRYGYRHPRRYYRKRAFKRRYYGHRYYNWRSHRHYNWRGYRHRHGYKRRHRYW